MGSQSPSVIWREPTSSRQTHTSTTHTIVELKTKKNVRAGTQADPPSGLTPYCGHHHQAFESLLQLYEARANYEEFCVPMCMLPATISNNVPGTDLSIGADTSLNAIVEVRPKT